MTLSLNQYLPTPGRTPGFVPVTGEFRRCGERNTTQLDAVGVDQQEQLTGNEPITRYFSALSVSYATVIRRAHLICRDLYDGH